MAEDAELEEKKVTAKKKTRAKAKTESSGDDGEDKPKKVSKKKAAAKTKKPATEEKAEAKEVETKKTEPKKAEPKKAEAKKTENKEPRKDSGSSSGYREVKFEGRGRRSGSKGDYKKKSHHHNKNRNNHHRGGNNGNHSFNRHDNDEPEVKIDLSDVTLTDEENKLLNSKNLKSINIQKLVDLAIKLKIENAAGMRRQDLVFNVLKRAAMLGDIFGSGCLEILPDGYGFLRSPDYNLSLIHI